MDITVIFDNATGTGDWTINSVSGDLQTGGDLETLVQVLLFTDRVLHPDETPPDGSGDARGVWFDTLDPPALGSRLWLLERAKISNRNETLATVTDIVNEALQLLIDEGIAQSIDVVPEFLDGTFIQISIAIYQPGNTAPTYFTYQWAWQALGTLPAPQPGARGFTFANSAFGSGAF